MANIVTDIVVSVTGVSFARYNTRHFKSFCFVFVRALITYADGGSRLGTTDFYECFLRPEFLNN
jgi:hypothetical protein